MTLLYFKYRQPATVTVTGSIDVPVGLLAPGREKELKDYIVRDGAHTYQNAKSDIDYEEIDGPEFQREELIAEVYGEADDPNVKLIAAAPDMPEALEDVWNAGVFECCCGALGDACDGTYTYTRVKLAIKKARGK